MKTTFNKHYMKTTYNITFNKIVCANHKNIKSGQYLDERLMQQLNRSRSRSRDRTGPVHAALSLAVTCKAGGQNNGL